MAKSFSSTDYKGVTVSGTIIATSSDSTLALVEEETPPLPPVLWMVDLLDDVGVSLDADQFAEMLPHIQKWIEVKKK